VSNYHASAEVVVQLKDDDIHAARILIEQESNKFAAALEQRGCKILSFRLNVADIGKGIL